MIRRYGQLGLQLNMALPFLQEFSDAVKMCLFETRHTNFAGTQVVRFGTLTTSRHTGVN